MKPAPFRYFAPRTLDEALALLVDHGDEAKLLAGGQSLVPAMNFRLAQPAVLVDLNRVADLAYVAAEGDGGGDRSGDSDSGGDRVASDAPARSRSLRIGAMTRQRAVERDRTVERLAPLLHRAMPFIAHAQIRNRGTIGGSLAHADPAAELPAVALALDASFLLRRQGGERWVAARDFYTGLFATALEPGEVLAEIVIPPAPARTGWSFQEVSRRHGDFALAGVACGVTLGDDGRCTGAVIALFGLGEQPTLAEGAAAMLRGSAVRDGVLDPKVVTVASRTAASDIDPSADIHASAAFRRHLAAVLVERAVSAATAQASK